MLGRRSSLARNLVVVTVALAISFVASVRLSLAQDQEEAQRRRLTFEKFVEIGQKAERRNDYLMAVGMYEAAIDRISGQDQYASTLGNISRCYLKLGYYWRVEPISEKLIAVLEQKPALITSSFLQTIKEYSELLGRLKKENRAAHYLQVLERLSKSQEKSQATSVGFDSTGHQQGSAK